MLRGGASSAGSKGAVPFLQRPEVPLQATAFVFVLGISLTTLTPAPHLVEQLGQARGMQLLTALATTSAAAEIALSPIVGGLADSRGRKPVIIGTLVSALLASLAAAVYPSVTTVAVSKFVSSAVVGIFFLGAGAVLADNFREDPKRLAATSGVLFALVNAGFGVGVALSGLLPPGLRSRYLASAGTCALALALGGSVRESMPPEDQVPFQPKSFNPFAFTRLLSVGSTMRRLSILVRWPCRATAAACPPHPHPHPHPTPPHPPSSHTPHLPPRPAIPFPSVPAHLPFPLRTPPPGRLDGCVALTWAASNAPACVP